MIRQHLTFDEYLQQKWEEQGGSDGLPEDRYEDAFNNWLSDQEGDMLIQWGNEAVELAASKTV